MTEQSWEEMVYNQQKEWEEEQAFYASEAAKAEADIKAQETEQEQEAKLRNIIEPIIVKTYGMAQGNRSEEDERIVRLATLTWARDELIRQVKDALPELAKEAGYLNHDEVQAMLNTLAGGFDEMAKIKNYSSKSRA